MTHSDVSKGWRKYVQRRSSWRGGCEKMTCTDVQSKSSTNTLELDDVKSIDGDSIKSPGYRCGSARGSVLGPASPSVPSHELSEIGIKVVTVEECGGLSQASLTVDGALEIERKSEKKKTPKQQKRRSAMMAPISPLSSDGNKGENGSIQTINNGYEKGYEKSTRKRNTVLDKLMNRRTIDPSVTMGSTSYSDCTFQELLPKLLRRADMAGNDGSINQIRQFMRDVLYTIQDQVFALSIEDESEMRAWGREKIAPEQLIYQLKDWDRKLRELESAIQAYDEIRMNSNNDTLACDDCMARTLEVKYLKELLQTTFEEKDALEVIKYNQSARIASQEEQIIQLRAQLAKANFKLRKEVSLSHVSESSLCRGMLADGDD
eukprot:CFRG8426T1